MMYDGLIKRLRNCATEAAPCNTCDYIVDGSCTDTLMKQAADAIEELLQKTQQLPSWIPVTERLPENTGKYLVCGQWNGKPAEIWICDLIVFGKIKGWSNNVRNPVVTHWMPLPEPPKKEES